MLVDIIFVSKKGSGAYRTSSAAGREAGQGGGASPADPVDEEEGADSQGHLEEIDRKVVMSRSRKAQARR